MGNNSISTPSKINLFLRVKGKTENGYHEIETLFVPLTSPVDKITITSSDCKGIELACSASDVPLNDKNLCWQAAEAYAKLAKISPSWRIDIAKNIPVAGGMAGGSSNAAAVLKILDRQYGLLSEDDIKSLALSIGADVPFFLNPVPSIGRGIGEQLEVLDFELPELPLLILAPQFPVSATWAYRHYGTCASSEANSIELDDVIAALREGDVEKLAFSLRNDLAPAIFNKFPILSILKEKLLNLGALNAEISGSGPTLFAICQNTDAVKEIAFCLEDELGSSISIF